MSIFCWLSRKHYWCTPHRSEDNRLIQVCYECGAERPARELHKEQVSLGPLARPLKVATDIAPKRAVPRVVAQPATVSNQSTEKIAVGQGSRRFVIVK